MEFPRWKSEPGNIISPDATIGENTRLWQHVQIRENAKIGSGCNIGKGVYVDQNVIIGNRVKIQNGVSVYQGVAIEDDVFVGPNVTFTNDMYPRAFSVEWRVVPTVIKKGASLGANSTIICGVTVGEYAMVGAGSVVVDDVPPFTLVAGNPAKILDRVCKCGVPLRKHWEQCRYNKVKQ